MRKTKEDTELSREKILNAAEEVFCTKGYSSAKMTEIAEMTGMTKGAIFWHFESKAGLFLAVNTRSLARLNEIITTTFSTSDSIMDKFRKALLLLKKDRAFDLLISLGDTSDNSIPHDIALEVHQGVSAVLETARGYLEEAKQRGELKSDTDVFAILSPLILIMSGLGKMNEVKNILGNIGSKINGETAINTIFKGLYSFQK